MTWDNSKYVKLLLWRPDSGADRWLIALRTTADYYGWTKHFETWRPKSIGTSGGYTLCRDPGRRGEMFCEGGRRLRICRSPKTGGNPAGFTNQFKVSRSCTQFDIAELAYLTNEGWYWMTGLYGQRIARESWLAIHSEKLRAERGAVSV
jgi:hypothetical protein